MIRVEIGPDLFRAACNMGLEGLISKCRDRTYQVGRSKKVKNRQNSAMNGAMEAYGRPATSAFEGKADSG